MRLKVGAATSVGKVRPSNEDAFLTMEDRGLFVVCDGMGGSAAGEVASQMAVQTISTEVAGATLKASATRGLQPRTTQLGHAIEAANRAIYERAFGESKHAGMGTTVVGAWVADNVVSIAHVGDQPDIYGYDRALGN
ncbi:MAG: protein phosphatase 2C domain-containing protein [Vicinamibacterales bacterium]